MVRMPDSGMRGTRPSVAGGATRVRGRARSVLRPSGPPTMPISVRGYGDQVSEWHTRAVIDFCLRLGEAMLVTGASVADTTASLLRVCRAYSLTGVHVDITYTSVTISMHRGVHRDPITVMRIVSHMGTDYSRLEALHTLVREVAENKGDPGDIEDNLGELEYILEQPHSYRRGIVTAAWAGMGAGVAMLLGGGVMMVFVAAFATALVDLVQVRLARRGLSAFFGQVVGATIAAGLAVVLIIVRDHTGGIWWLAQVRPSIVVASSIVALLAGMSVVTAAQDTLDGFYLTAGARTYEVILLTGGIVAGVLLVLSLARRAGVNLYVIPTNGLVDSRTIQIVAAALIAGAFAISAHCAPRAVLVSTAVGGASWAVFATLSALTQASQAVASGVAAFAIGCVAPTLTRRLHVPSIAVTAAGIVPLLPGLAVYKGVIYFVTQNAETTWVDSFLVAILVGLALSVGVSLGTLLGRQISAGADSLTSKVLRRTVQQTD